MHSPMGQTATTLNSLIDLYGMEADGVSEELIESQLLQARRDLIESVRGGGDSSAPVDRLVHLKCPVSMKYAQLNVRQLLKDNNESVGHLKAVPVALGMLEKYGRHLLKPAGARVEQWRQIKFNNPIFKDRVLPMQGAVEIVQQMGYSEAADCGLQFAFDEPDPEATSNLVADIVLARTEMERYLTGKHPHPETIHAYLPESTIDQLLLHWGEVQGAEAATVNVNPPPAFIAQQAPPHSHPTPVSTAVESGAQGKAPDNQSAEAPAQVMETGEGVEVSPSPVQEEEDSLTRVCDICGENAATFWCQQCDNKQLCDICDDMWHRHPKRQKHERNPISSFPSPSSACPADAIMGPFGIRAVHSLSVYNRDVERSPAPVSETNLQQQQPQLRENLHTPPPQQCQPSPPRPSPPMPAGSAPQLSQSTLSTQASLAQHQHQLQFYLQQQQLLQQQQQQQQQPGTAPLGPYPPQPFSTSGVTLSQESLVSARRLNGVQPPLSHSQMAGYPPFPTLDPDPAGSQLQPQPQPHHPRTNNFPLSLGYGDISLSHQSTSQASGSAAPYALTTTVPENSSSSGKRAAAGSRRGSSPSGSSGLMSESSLLKTVLAETDYERRAAKCDVRLVTLDEDLLEVEVRLEDMMLGTADFTESDEFRTLNRHKARLMKERRALSDYRQELADLMAAEAPLHPPDRHGDGNSSFPSSQIFHPPALSTMPSVFASPQQSVAGLSLPSSSPTQAAQLGFSYPHQASQSPVHAQEAVSTPSAFPSQVPQTPQRVASPPQPHAPFHQRGGQESTAPNAQPSPNSCVDQSSILPQWQMYPTSNVPLTAPGAGVPRPVSYPPVRYQQGGVPSANTFAVPVSEVPFSQPNLSPSPMGTLEQRRSLVVPVPQQEFGGMSSNVGQRLSHNAGFLATGGRSSQEVNGPPAPLAVSSMYSETGQPVTVQSSPGGIGFENWVPLQPEIYQPVQPQQQQQQQRPSSGRPTGPPPLESQAQQALRASGAPFSPSPPPQPPQPQLTPQQAPRVVPPVVSLQSQKFDVHQGTWQCSHCTFINEPQTRVCTMCDRTSDNPVIVHCASSRETAASGDSVSRGVTLPNANTPREATGTEGASVPLGGAQAAETLNANKEQLARIEGKIAEEQDQVYLEKKEAREQYFKSLQQQEHGKSVARSSTPPHGPPPPLASAEVVPPPPRPPVPTRRPASSPADGKQPSSAVGSVKESASEGVVTADPKGQAGDSGGGRSGGKDGGEKGPVINMKDFSQAMETLNEQKRKEQQERDGAEHLHYFKLADKQGFHVEEMELALTKCQNRLQEALTWLTSEWGKLVQVVCSSTRAEGQKSEQNDVGDLSPAEARRALRESKGDMVSAVKSCVAKRRQMYSALNPEGSFAREDVLQAMQHSRGEEEAARDHLYSSVLQPFVDRVWRQREGSGEAGRGACSQTLLQMTMADGTGCQSVPTSVIARPDFQQTIMDPNIDRDRRIRMILVEGKLKSWGRAEMVVKLLEVDLPSIYPPPPGGQPGQEEEAPFSLEDVVEAVRNCRDRQSARVYLAQECSTCFSNYPMSKIRNLNFCQCKICSNCLKQNFEVVIRERHVRHWTCPICGLPDLNDADTASEYLSFLGLLLQRQVDKDVYELFETKVRDWHLQKDPNFRWCAHCGNGFIADQRRLRMECPHCGDKTCYNCKKQWEDQHDGVTCEQFAQWKIDNDPNNQAVGLARHLEENGIDCPSCKMRYALAKGGCMHFKCPQCGHEFCSGCYQPFYQKGACRSRLKSCKSSGLHAHHPRDCFFYLRDEDVACLQKLLRDSHVVFNTTPPESQENSSRCPVIEQKEFDSGKCDESCDKETAEGHAGLCILHYKEYLVGLINKNNIDPLISMTMDDLKNQLKRAEIACPKLNQNESEANYYKRLIKFVKEKIPLPTRGP